MRYHLGCGSRYLKGYCNVDFPQDHHDVNTNVKADLYADLLKMEYEPCSEIFSSHVFEHFGYVDSFVLLRRWTDALCEGGHLSIEVPDVATLAQALVGAPPEKAFRIVRYLYGSHEADWAYHINGWTDQTLAHILKKLGYEFLGVHRNGDPNEDYPNCSVKVVGQLATKIDTTKIDAELMEAFELYSNGDTKFERKLLAYHRDRYSARVSSL